MSFVRQLGRFVQKITDGMRSCDERFVEDVVHGVCHRRSVLLTEIGRAIDEGLDLHDTEKRLSRMAGTVHFADEVLEQNYLAAMAAHVNRLGYIVVDIGDIQTKGSRDVPYRVRYSFIPVRVRGIEGTFGLVVVDAGRKERMMLLCWRIPENEAEAARFIKAYLRRWGIEDDGRALKQLADIEDVRVQSLRGIRRMVQLATIALGWLCHVLLSCPVLAVHLLSRAKTVGKEPLYKAYRLMEGLRAGG